MDDGARRGRAAGGVVRPDADPAGAARPGTKGVRRERLARAANAALLARGLPRAPRRRGPRRRHAPRVPGHDAEPGRPPDEARHRPARPLPHRRRADPDRAGRGRPRPRWHGSSPRTSSRSPTPRATRCCSTSTTTPGRTRTRSACSRSARALVGNSLVHTPPGRRCSCGSSARGPRVALVVEDDGPGIPPEHLEQVFQRFYRVEGGQASGSGLGLAIARELAGLMGGTVTVASRPGATAFTLELPAEARRGARGRRAEPARFTWKPPSRNGARAATGAATVMRRATPASSHRARRRFTRRGAAVALGSVTGLTDGGSTTVVVEPDAAGTAPTGRTGPAARQPFDPAAIYARRAPGVVTLYADLGSEGQAQGSGFVVDGKGTILTNAHVVTNVAEAAGPPVHGAAKLYVEFRDGDRVPARIVGWDLFSDVARRAGRPAPTTPSSPFRSAAPRPSSSASRSPRSGARSTSRARSRSASSPQRTGRLTRSPPATASRMRSRPIRRSTAATRAARSSTPAAA